MRFTQILAARLKNPRRTWYMPKPTLGEVTKKYANLPESYLEACLSREYWRTPRGINYLPRIYEDGKAILGIERPWAIEGKMESDELQGDIPYVEPLRDWFFFKGDRVQVLTGNDKGKQGIISYVVQERNWVLVRGLNTEIVPRTLSGITIYSKQERPLLVTSQVSLVDPGDLQPTKAEWAYTEDGELVRISARSGRIIPFSKMKEETYDYKLKSNYKDSPKDTSPEDVQAVTFNPSLKTFEMDIADQHEIQEDRVPAKSYWY